MQMLVLLAPGLILGISWLNYDLLSSVVFSLGGFAKFIQFIENTWAMDHKRWINNEIDELIDIEVIWIKWDKSHQKCC